MKAKKITFVLIAFAVTAIAGVNIHQNKEIKAVNITISSIEAIAACEVSSDSSKNTGNCVKEMGTNKDTCVSATVIWAVDCSGNI